MSKTERQKYKIAGPATWELIRAAYLAGESAPALAERFGVNAHGIRKRITKEKWTKRDYAAALEARGLPPPPKPEPLNIAARFAANHQPPAPPPEPAHPFEDLVEALKAATAAAERAPAPAPVSPSAAAAAIEQQALARVGEALAKGRAADAKTLAALAEQMRKRAADERGAVAAKEEEARLSEADREDAVKELFSRIAQIAVAMLHEPTAAPGAFLRLIKRWREINLGEGEADAEARAGKIAASLAHYLSGEIAATMPEDVRAYCASRWSETRAQLEAEA